MLRYISTLKYDGDSRKENKRIIIKRNQEDLITGQIGKGRDMDESASLNAKEMMTLANVKGNTASSS